MSGRPTRNSKACTSCRQVKLRCDSMQNFPSACSRCRKNNLECRIDPTFERTRTRQKLHEVTSQLKAIQTTLGNINTSGSDALPRDARASPSTFHDGSQSSPYEVSTESMHDSGLETHSDENSFFRYEKNEDLPTSSVRLGQVQLEPDQVRQIFKNFHNHHYRHFPVLDIEKSVSELYESSPILFWTIIIISTRLWRQLSRLHKSLISPYQVLLGQVLVGPITSLESMHGIMLICIWPLAVDNQGDDPSWNYCGLIYHAAMKLGLHKNLLSSGGTHSPKNAYPPSDAKLERMRTKTWMGCVHIFSRFILYTGLCLPPELSKRSKPLEPPLSRFEKDYVTKYEVYHQAVKASVMMSNLDEHQDCFSFCQLLCKEMDDIRSLYRKSWNKECEIKLLGAQLSIYSALLQRRVTNTMSEGSSTGTSEGHSSKRMIIQLGFSTAVKLIHTFSKMIEEESLSPNIALSADGYDTEAPQRFLPKDFSLALMLATSFIFKAVASSSKNFVLDNDVARNHIHIVHSIVSTMTIEPMDEAARAVRLIEILTREPSLSQLHLREPSMRDAANMSILDEVIKTGQRIRAKSKGGSNATTPFSPETRGQAPEFTDCFDDPVTGFYESRGVVSFENLDFSIDGLYNFDLNGPWELNFPLSDMPDIEPGSAFGDPL